MTYASTATRRSTNDFHCRDDADLRRPHRAALLFADGSARLERRLNNAPWPCSGLRFHHPTFRACRAQRSATAAPGLGEEEMTLTRMKFLAGELTIAALAVLVITGSFGLLGLAFFQATQ
jgi:hypothetical protein